jgi:hypothetical protein
MSEDWKTRDRPRPPCVGCGEELYDKFYGGGGWVPTEQATDKTHSDRDCVKVLKAKLAARESTPTDEETDYAIALAREWLALRGLSQTSPRRKLETDPADYDMADDESLAKLLLMSRHDRKLVP